MHRQDAIYLDQLCPKISNKNWRESLYKLTKYKCIYCGKPSESLDHLHPMSKGGLSSTSNCVPCCLSCNGKKSDCLLYTSPSPRDRTRSRMPSSA